MLYLRVYSCAPLCFVLISFSSIKDPNTDHRVRSSWQVFVPLLADTTCQLWHILELPQEHGRLASLNGTSTRRVSMANRSRQQDRAFCVCTVLGHILKQVKCPPLHSSQEVIGVSCGCIRTWVQSSRSGTIASSKCIVAFAENPGCCGKLLNFIDSVVPFRPRKSHLYFGLPFPYERPIVWHFKYSIDAFQLLIFQSTQKWAFENLITP